MDELLFSSDSAMAAVQALGQRRRRVPPDLVEHRAERAHNLIQMGELSAARQALDGDPVAPGNDAALRALRDPQRRPQAPRGPLATELAIPDLQGAWLVLLFCAGSRANYLLTSLDCLSRLGALVCAVHVV